MGLFRYVQAVGTVRDLKVTATSMPPGTLNEIGAIVGTNYGTISGCSFNGTISGENNVGGIAGHDEGSGMIYNCQDRRALSRATITSAASSVRTSAPSPTARTPRA